MFDELNYFDYDTVENELRAYFSEMPEITEEQLNERVSVGHSIYDMIVMFLLMVQATEVTNQVQNIEYYVTMLGRRYRDIYTKHDLIVDEYTENYINFITRKIVNTTFEHIDYEKDKNDFEYDVPTYAPEGEEDTTSKYLLPIRGISIAENEANTALNYNDFKKAINNGFTKKMWISKRDGKVRNTHVVVDGTIRGIKEYFIVGTSYMLFPHDLSMNPAPKEYIHCRCHIQYIK